MDLSRRYAPYILQNETSLPLLFHVYRGHVNSDALNMVHMKEGNIMQPCSVPIYIDETPEEQLFRYEPAHFMTLRVRYQKCVTLSKQSVLILKI